MLICMKNWESWLGKLKQRGAHSARERKNGQNPLVLIVWSFYPKRGHGFPWIRHGLPGMIWIKLVIWVQVSDTYQQLQLAWDQGVLSFSDMLAMTPTGANNLASASLLHLNWQPSARPKLVHSLTLALFTSLWPGCICKYTPTRYIINRLFTYSERYIILQCTKEGTVYGRTIRRIFLYIKNRMIW